MSIGRRGIMYTLVAIILLIVIGNIFFTQSRRTGRDVASAEADRIKAINSFLHSVEDDGHRAAYISGFHSLIAMEQLVTNTGTFIADPDAAFKEAFVYGTIGNQSFIILQNSTFNDYLARVQWNAARQGMTFNATVSNVSLWQVDPWNVLVNYTLDIALLDGRGTARWYVHRTFMDYVPITDVRDPLFSANTYGRIQRTIRRSNVTTFVNDAGDANDTTGFVTHFNSSCYVAFGRGPSILMRFAGNFSDSPYGIESLVDVNDLTAQNLAPNTTASVVDYQYFSGVPATVCNIQKFPAIIKLDDASKALYQIEGNLNYTTC